ncbi:MAG: YceI family protein [Candidatus Obscuribacterales bacterium]|nr:YceI family protein [Candidatus Obscuribacterales bacterium]
MQKQLGLLLSLAFFLGAAASAADQWTIDPKHSSATFTIKHMMVSNVRGQMGGITGSAIYDGKNVDSAKVNASLDPATINTNEADRDKHLRSADFFDVEKYPKITFVSTGTVPVLNGGFKLGGKLTMHGVTKNIELTVDGPTESLKDPQGTVRIGATGTTKINRKDFGISYNKLLDNGGVALGEEVQIVLDLELTKQSDKK